MRGGKVCCMGKKTYSRTMRINRPAAKKVHDSISNALCVNFMVAAWAAWATCASPSQRRLICDEGSDDEDSDDVDE